MGFVCGKCNIRVKKCIGQIVDLFGTFGFWMAQRKVHFLVANWNIRLFDAVLSDIIIIIASETNNGYYLILEKTNFTN